MTATYRPGVEELKVAEWLLSEAIGHLAKYLRPDDRGCAVLAEARDASSIYLESWVQDALLNAYRALHGLMSGHERQEWLGLIHGPYAAEIELRARQEAAS